MRLFYDPHINPGTKTHTLSPEESKHIVRVLRMKEGDELALLDGNGNYYDCVLTESSKSCKVSVRRIQSREHPVNSIHIAIAPTKQNDRMEWFVEKATEIGVNEISFLRTKNSERIKLKLDRFERKAVSAMKQSGRWFLPKINEVSEFSSFVKENPKGLIAHCYDGDKTNILQADKSLTGPILIGPEGDFTNEELAVALDNGYKSITLGNNRLRTETAGIVACTEAALKLL